MSDWLYSATRLFRARPEMREQPYELHCPCGQTFRGIRVEIPQSLECDGCRVRHFVLPLSCYPAPKEGTRRGIRDWLTQPVSPRGPQPAATPAADDNDPEVAVLLEPDPPLPAQSEESAVQHSRTPAPGAPRPKRTSSSPRPRGAQRPAIHRKSLATHQAPSDPQPPDTSTTPAQPNAGGVRLKPLRTRGKVLTSVRLVFLLMIGVSLIGGWWLHRMHSRSLAEQSLGENTRAGAAALERGDLLAAAEHYERVVAAIELLGREEPRALTIRQTGRETVARARLCGTALEDLLHEGAQTEFQSETARNELFQREFRDRWIVVDAAIVLSSDSRRGFRCQIDCPIASGTASARLQGDLMEFNRLPLSAQEPRRVIFAAQLRSLSLDPQAGGQVVIDFDPWTGFLWSNADALEKLGFHLDDETRDTLRTQSQLLGISS